MKYIFISLLLFGIHTLSKAQKKYFQQEVAYEIHVSLDDIKHELNAKENIVYTNNSPDDLHFIYFHLWPNAYKNGSTALSKQLLEAGKTVLYESEEENIGYIDELDFQVDGKQVNWEPDPEHIDICKINLDSPLKSGEKITISTPFRVKLPVGSISRLGHGLNDQSYQITQWYPKPAVYDKDGWHPMPYLNQGEFYSEYGTYDVYITLPDNYVIGATGDLIDGEKEVEWLNKKANETAARTSFDKKDLSFPASSATTKIVHYHQEQVHDFAWFADKRFHVLKGEVELPHSKRKVSTWAMFLNSSADLWMKSLEYLHDAIYYYSFWNGDYPYNQVTAVDGSLTAGGGMEYPNVTVISTMPDDFSLETVIMHEVGHNWFYGILGSNERMHPWMDEGINSFNENRYIETKYPNKKLVESEGLNKMFDLGDYKHKAQYEFGYLINAARGRDQAIETPAADYTEINYGGIVYHKTALVFDYLLAYIGEEKFDKAMQRYFEEWKFKHPQPEDLRKILEEESGKNLSWFFDDLINTTKLLDYKILKAKKQENGTYDVTLKNTGGISAPLNICGTKDTTLLSIVWYDGFEDKQTLSLPAGDYDRIRIDCLRDMPEVNRNNNILKTRGLFKKVEPLKLQFLGSADHPEKSQIFYLPIIGWNKYNALMGGFAFYNNLFPQKKLEYVVMPLYSFGTKDISGNAAAYYHLHFRNGFLQHLTFGLTYNRFAYFSEPFPINFNRLSPQVVFEFRKKTARHPLSNSISLRHIHFFNDAFFVRTDVNPVVFDIVTNQYALFEAAYTMKNDLPLHPSSLSVIVQGGDDMGKTFLTANKTYNFKHFKVDMRLFGGAFISNSSIRDYRFRTSGQTGYQDYMHDYVFFGRSERTGFWSQQFLNNDGGFKVLTPIGQTKEWLSALNIASELPLSKKVAMSSSKNAFGKRQAFGVFLDVGTYSERWSANASRKFIYDAGVSLSLIKDVIKIYVPLLMSKELKDNLALNQVKFEETIRFSINWKLNDANPYKPIKNILSNFN